MTVQITPFWLEEEAGAHYGFHVLVRVFNFKTGQLARRPNGSIISKYGLIDTGSSISLFPRAILPDDLHPRFDHPDAGPRYIRTMQDHAVTELNLPGYRHFSVIELSTPKPAPQRAVLICKPYYVEKKWSVVSSAPSEQPGNGGDRLVMHNAPFDGDCIIGLDLLRAFDLFVSGHQRANVEPLCLLNGTGVNVFPSWHAAKEYLPPVELEKHW